MLSSNNVQSITARTQTFIANVARSPEVEMHDVDTFNLGETPFSITPRDSEFDLFDVGGNEEILKSLSDLVEYLSDPDSFKGLNAPKGVILSGPPGVGKTFMAEAIAGHAGVKLFQVSASALQATMVGGTEKNLRDLFEQVRKATPCVLCLDEIDALGQKRFDSPHQGSEQCANSVVDQLLTLLTDKNEGFVIVATTNNFETLDPALVRAGRFDRHIVVPKPDLASRIKILEKLTSKLVDKVKTERQLDVNASLLDPSLSIEYLARECEGYSGAELAALVNEAGLNAARKPSFVIDIGDFDQAKNLVKNGVIGHPIYDAKQKERTATHEAAHAIVGHVLQRKLLKISILQYGSKLGGTDILPCDSIYPTQQELLDEICIALAGRAGEMITKNVQCGNNSDIKKAKEIALKMIQEGMGDTLIGDMNPYGAENILQKELKRATEILEKNKDDWEKIIQALIKNDMLLEKNFIDVLAGKDINNSTKENNQKRAMEEPTLPPSKRKKKSATTKNEQINLTKVEIAKSLGISPRAIEDITIEEINGLAIKFSNVVSENQLEAIATILYENYILNSRSERTIYVDKGNLDDFETYVKSNSTKQISSTAADSPTFFKPEVNDRERNRKKLSATKEEIAKAFEVDSENILSIEENKKLGLRPKSNFGVYIIEFRLNIKPDMQKISQELLSRGIDNLITSCPNTLTFSSNDITDFEKFVKEKNASGYGPAPRS